MKEVKVSEQVTITIVTTLAFANIGWIAWLLISTVRRVKVARAQAEIQSKLLEKFGSSQELLAYMQTEAGQRFIQIEVEPVAATKGPQAKILSSIKVGTILACLGLGLLILSAIFKDEAPIVLGTLALAIGLGFLVSSGISFKLSRSWGLINGEATGSSRSE
jgi:hypothetical protein